MIGSRCLAGFLAAASATPALAQAGERLLDAAAASGPADCPTVTFRFSAPIRYNGVSPDSPAIEARLRVEPAQAGAYALRDTLAPPDGTSLIRSIAYMRDAAGGPTMTVSFKALTRFEVALGNDAQSLVLNLENTTVAGACTAVAEAEPAAPPALEPAELQRLQNEAEEAILRKDFDAAMLALDRILAGVDSAYTPRALELTGMIHERRGQAALARQRYEEYLRRFPDHNGAGRIRQRLAGLPAGSSAGKSLAAGNTGQAPEREGWRLDVSGGFSQFYSRDTSRNTFIDARRPDPVEEIDRRVNIDQLLSTLDVTASASNGRTRLSARASGSYTQDFRPATLVGSSRSSGDDTQRIYALYVDASDEELGLSARIGRQPLFGSGVFGRFDGARLGWQASPAVTLNVQSGYPVFSTRTDRVIRDRWFYGFSLKYAPPDSRYDLTAYWFDQRTHGLVDRRSIGFEGRYRGDKVNLFGLADFDIEFGKLSYFFLSANLPFADGSNLTVQADLQYYPPLTLGNAVIGQPVPRLEELKRLFDRDVLRKLAEDRSARSRNLAITYSRPVSERWLADLDLVIANVADIPASGGVQAIEGSGTEIYVGAQFVGSSILLDNDTLIFGARYADTQRFHIYAGELAARLPVAAGLGIEPRLRLAHRTDKFGPGHQTAWRPSIRATYEASRRVAFDAELGFVFFEQRQQDAAFLGRNEERATILNIGYRLSF